jgi:serine/threonine-protein kinase
MTDRWQQIDELYLAVIERPIGERDQFLADACGADPALLAEVRALLFYETRSIAFLEGLALTEEARSMVDESGPSLVGQQIGGYEIESLVGAGGTGEVYRAKDTKLGRVAALKVLGRFVTRDSRQLRRFEEEARLASGLNHPNIITIYGIGDHDGIVFIAMEFVEGRTLRDLCSDTPLTVERTLDLAGQMADALAAAHGISIVHGDLKPENVMVTGRGILKVLDFGVATRQALGPIDAGSSGLVVGSLGYIAPEVVDGQKPSPGSDQFSFGAILYEMLSGRRAFARPSAGDTIAAIVEDPAPLRTLNTGVPPRLHELVERCLQKDPSARYADTNELADAIRQIHTEHVTRPFTRRHVLWLGAAAVATLGGLAVWRTNSAPARVRSLAVLPFIDASVDGSAEHLSDGLTSNLINRIAQLPSLTLASRTAVFFFKGKKIDARAAGRQLDVDAVLTGTVSRSSTRLFVTAELLDVNTGTQLWSQRFDRVPADLVLIQDEIVDAIVDDAVKLRVSIDERHRLRRHPTNDPDAYEMYLRAMHHIGRETEEDYLKARDLLYQALGKDERFAYAHRALASTYSVMAIDGFERPTEAWPQSHRHVRRALEFDPDLPDAHAEAAAQAFFFNWDWKGAEREWQTAMQSPAGHVEPDLLLGYSLQCFALGRLEDALRLVRDARRIDPLSLIFKVREADLLLHAGETDKAAELYERAIRDDPADPRAHFGLAEARRRQGRYADALYARRQGHLNADGVEFNELVSSSADEQGYQRIEEASARMQLQTLNDRAIDSYASPLDFARVHALLGHKDESFGSLELAFRDRSAGLVFLNVDRAWKELRSEPRFAASVDRVGLVVASRP